MKEEKKLLIGEILVKAGIIDKEQLNIALEKQRENPKTRLGRILLELGFVTYKDLLYYLEKQIIPDLVCDLYQEESAPIGYIPLKVTNNNLIKQKRFERSYIKFHHALSILKKDREIAEENLVLSLYHVYLAGMETNKNFYYPESIGLKNIFTGITGSSKIAQHIVWYDTKQNFNLRRLKVQAEKIFKTQFY